MQLQVSVWIDLKYFKRLVWLKSFWLGRTCSVNFYCSFQSRRTCRRQCSNSNFFLVNDLLVKRFFFAFLTWVALTPPCVLIFMKHCNSRESKQIIKKFALEWITVLRYLLNCYQLEARAVTSYINWPFTRWRDKVLKLFK